MRWSGQRGLRDRIFEQHACLRQLVQIRRGDLGVTVASEAIRAKRVDRHENQVHSPQGRHDIACGAILLVRGLAGTKNQQRPDTQETEECLRLVSGAIIFHHLQPGIPLGDPNTSRIQFFTSAFREWDSASRSETGESPEAG
jgi:hypothetical protein